MSLYKDGQRQIILVLQDALSSIYISFDSCISPSALGIFEIVGHFTDEKRRLQALLLAFIGVEETYTRDQLAT